jgi:hypothetical protein
MFDFYELSNLYFSNVAGWFSPAVQNNNLQFNSAGAMKKTLLITSTIMSLLSMIGCSQFEDTTSVGSQLIQEADPSFLDFDKNFTPFRLDTSIVTNSKSIPEDENSSNFGIHASTSLPVGGRNGEISTAYYQFLPSISNWLSCRNIDTLVDSTNIFSTELILSKSKDSLNSVCNYNQEVNLLLSNDSTYKYNRNQSKVDEILKEQNSNILFNQKVDFTKLKLSFNDTSILTKKIREVCSFKRKEYSALKTDSARAKFRETLKLPTLNFIIASKKADTNYALMSGAAALKVHFYKGNYQSSTLHKVKDTTFKLSDYTIITKDSLIPGIKTDTLLRDTAGAFDTLFNVKVGSILKKVSPPSIVNGTPKTDTLPSRVDTLPQVKSTRRVKVKENTLVIDTVFSITKTTSYIGIYDTSKQVTTSSYIRIDSLIDSTVLKPDSIRYVCKTWHYVVDQIIPVPRVSKKAKIDSSVIAMLDTITMSADSLTIPLLYSNYVMFERKDTLYNRFNFATTPPISSYGPQRTAVFELNIDTLWKKLAQQPTDGKPAFNKILSAGVAITGTLDSSFKKAMSDSTDTTISVRWFVSEDDKKIINDGLLLHKADKAIGMVDTLKSGKEAVLPIEKNLQEIMSRTTVTDRPPRVYLYLEPISSKNYNKQVFWSKPSLLTVLTTSHKE